MLLARHPALNQLIGVMLGLALAVGDMANAWQEQGECHQRHTCNDLAHATACAPGNVSRKPRQATMRPSCSTKNSVHNTPT